MSHPEKDGKMDDQKEGSDGETDINSPDVQAFIDLVDREAHLFALLKENGQIQEKNQLRHGIGWQPTFVIQDFHIPSRSVKQNASPTSELLDLNQPSNKGGDGASSSENMGMKRRCVCLGSSSNEFLERNRKKIPTDAFPHDLTQMNEESLDLWNLWQRNNKNSPHKTHE
ncbi:hypothetical protein ACLOJK_021706 [Asimina triloba]